MLRLPSVSGEVLCSCPPFECTCDKSRAAYKPFLPPYGMMHGDPLAHSHPPPPPPPITQINITNAYPPHPGGSSLDLFLRGPHSTSAVPPYMGATDSAGCSSNISPRLLGPSVSVGQGTVSVSTPAAGVVRVPSGSGSADVFDPSQRVPSLAESHPAHTPHSWGSGEPRPRVVSTASTPPSSSHGQNLSPPAFTDQQAEEPELVEERLAGQSATTPPSSSTFLSPSTEALFEGPSRMEELCTAPEVKTEPLSSLCTETRSLAIGAVPCSSSSAVLDPSLELARQMTHVGEGIVHGGSRETPHFLTSRSPTASGLGSMSAPESDSSMAAAAYSSHVMTSSPILHPHQHPLPQPQHPQGHTPTLQDKRFEELRPVQQRQFPGQAAPKTAFDVLHHPGYFRDDPAIPGFSPSRLRTDPLGSLLGPQDGNATGVSHGSAMIPRSGGGGVGDLQPGVVGTGEMAGSSWYGRPGCPSDCYQRVQGSNPYTSGVYKQACNHSINITLTYN